jgi:polysaccharide chain length determinant protein (PEP-CTERM system associated)
MQDIVRLVFSYIIGIWRYRWMIVLVPALISPVGWFFVATLPDEYKAAAKVYVDTDSVLTPLLKGIVVRVDDRRRIGMMAKLLFSRQILDKLARMTDQDLKAKTPEEMDDLLESLKKRVTLRESSANIFELGFTDESPELAKRVVQAFLTIFVETNLGESRKDQDSAEQFLLRESKEYERRLVEAETKLKTFKSRNLAYLSNKGGYFEELQGVKSKQEEVKLEYQMAEERRKELEEQLLDFESEDFGSFDDGVDDLQTLSPMEQRINEMRLEIDQLLLRYTERHPDVMALKSALGRLEKESEAATVDEAFDEGFGEESGTEKSMMMNPVYQQMKMLLTESEADVASRYTMVKEYERRIDVLQREVGRVLEIEAEQKQLNRDYGILSSKHQNLLEKLESLRLGREVDTTADTVRFRVIEPPKVPDEPFGPNRILFSSIVFGASLGLGIGFAFLISIFRPTFSDRKQLSEFFDLPVLGSVDMIWTDEQTRKKRLFDVVFGLSFFILIGAFATLITVYQLDIDVLSRIPLL